MPAALVAMSHSPLLDFVEVPADVASDVNGAFDAARAFAKDFDPQLVVTFAPDHYNGFFYDTMPPFCVGLRGFGCDSLVRPRCDGLIWPRVRLAGVLTV